MRVRTSSTSAHKEFESCRTRQEIKKPRQTAFRWSAYIPRRRRSQLGLVAFEAWNLLVIFAALVGFNYVPALASSSATFRAIWVAAVGTVAVTGYCVLVWTRESRHER